MDFARSQLLKYGWEDGKGLGKRETGICEPVKVKLKNDKTGIGHDIGKEYTNHWWNNVFDKTASSIKVTNTQNGVEIKRSRKHEKEISKNLQTYSKKAMPYGNFVRKATLSNGIENEESHSNAECDGNTADNRDEPNNYCLIPANEDEIFSKCGGRTAHKGARHGLKLNGKLQRIHEQEQLLLDKINSNLTDQSNGNKECMEVKGTKRKKKKKNSIGFDKDKQSVEGHLEDGVNQFVDGHLEDGVNQFVDGHLEDCGKSKRKKKKRKLNGDFANENDIVTRSEVISEYEIKLGQTKHKDDDRNVFVKDTDIGCDNVKLISDSITSDNDCDWTVKSKKMKKKKEKKRTSKDKE